MKLRTPKILAKWVWVTIATVVVLAGVFTWNRWFPATSNWVNQTITAFRSGGLSIEGEAALDDADPHAGHDHAAHVGHDEATSLELSQQALRNVGLTADQIRPIKLETFRKSITVPAVVVERTGANTRTSCDTDDGRHNSRPCCSR